jgi:uncharacterized protein (DUF58 family)
MASTAPSVSPTERARQRAEQLASVLPPLQVAAERVASTVIQGVHGRRRVGPGEAFWQFRRYQPGDATARIDWRMSARGRFVFVRENEWEAAQSVWLWCDPSNSMHYRSKRGLTEKRERAELLTMATAALLLRGGERVALLGHGIPTSSRATLTRLAQELTGEDDASTGKTGTGKTGAGTKAEPGTGMPPDEALPRYGKLVLFGDCFTALEAIQQTVARYAARGVRGHIVQILDPAELALPFTGRIRFEGMEGEGRMLARRAEALRDDYGARLETHRDGIAEIVRAVGWTFARHVTDQPAESALLGIYAALAGPERR